MLNKFIVIAIALFAVNYASDGFVFQQLAKEDVGQYGASVACAAGIYMATPMYNGLPIVPGADDIVFALVLGFFILGVWEKRLNPKQKIALFVGIWLAYKLAGWYLIQSTPGCVDYLKIYEGAMSPLTPIFLIIAGYLLLKMTLLKKQK